MNLGDKIKQSRMSMGLSQDQLAQKLSVNVQTVAAWENSQSIPDDEKLNLLKNILNFEDLTYSTETYKDNNERQPLEWYRFIFSPDEFSQIHKFQRRSLLKMPLAVTLMVIIFTVFSTYNSVSDITIGFLAGVFIMTWLLYIKGLTMTNKNYEKSIIKVCQSIYDYFLYDSYLKIHIYRNNELVYDRKIYYNDIERIFMLKNWLLLQINGQYFIVRKNYLKENSVFYSLINSNSLNNTAFDGIGIYRNVSIALNVLSILSLPIAYTVAQSISTVEGTLPENMWVAFLFLPLPVLSIVYGIVMTAKGGKFKANIVNGSIFALLLFIFGMFYVMF